MRRVVTWLRRYFSYTDLDRELDPPLLLPVRFRIYESRDFHPLMAIYRMNAHGRFPTDNEERFAEFLRAGRNGILVGEFRGKPICCAGLEQSGQHVFTFCYNLIHPDYQGQRLGSTLTLLRAVASAAKSKPLTLHRGLVFAVPDTLPFYRRFGFQPYGTWTGTDDQEYPAAVLEYETEICRHIDSIFAWRGLKIKGDFAPAINRSLEAKFTTDGLGRKCIRLEPLALPETDAAPGLNT